MATAVRVVVNPSDPEQKYVLWDNGRIDAKGGAPAISGNPTWYGDAQPLGPPLYSQARALQITDWSAPGGYVMDWVGIVYPFGNATAPAGNNAGINGFPIAADFSMNPNANGDGYVLSWSGELHVRGNANPLLPLSNPQHYWSLGSPNDRAHRLIIEWPGLEFYIFTRFGYPYAGNGAPAITTYPYWPWWEIARAWALADDGFTSGKGYALDGWGGVHRLNSAEAPKAGPYWQGWDIARDLKIVYDGQGAEPLTLVMLDGLGGLHEWVTSTPPVAAVVSPTLATITDRTRFTLGWSYADTQGDAQQRYEVAVISSAVYGAGGTDEVQRVTITGTPTGGSFRLTLEGETTAAIAYNANAAAVQAALEALPNVEVGDVTCTGGPLPGAFVTCTFAARLGKWDLAAMIADGALLTGGTSPAVAVTTPTPGVGSIDPAVATAVFRADGKSPARRGVDLTVDLVTGTTYRVFVRVQDTAEQWSPWAMRQVAISLTLPTTPTGMTATDQGGLDGIDLAANVATPDPSWVVRFEYHDSDWDGSTWETVRDADALVPDGGGDVAATDYEARVGIVRTYRATTYVADPYLPGTPSSTDTATLTATPSGPAWLLTAVDDPTLGGAVTVIEPYALTRPVRAGVFYPVGRANPIVTRDGGPKGYRTTLHFRTLDAAAYALLDAVISYEGTLLIRDPFGAAWYLVPVGDLESTLIRAEPTNTETTPLRHLHEWSVEVAQVDRPPVVLTTTPVEELIPAP